MAVPITLTTDFGTRDGYAGVMKGVITRIYADVSFIDITHEAPSWDLRGTAFLLWSALPYFREDSIHVVVVDPGVGTQRRAIAVWTPWGTLVGPDNGVFSYVWETARPTFMVSLDDEGGHLPYVSGTFHGRDIFAPVAAHIARGVPMRDLGTAIRDPVRLPLPLFESSVNRLAGEVLYIDTFGNAITSIGQLLWENGKVRLAQAFGSGPSYTFDPAQLKVRVGGRELGALRYTYADAAPGEPLALVGSSGMIEIAINQGHAATELGLAVGDKVEILS
ncbi:MAG: SAM-dependent chlorinase/fluorinase [Anaerolineae bacterium]|nr:SAM-dependent chlorinase/fluorinase [Anaerolineae bacterium]